MLPLALLLLLAEPQVRIETSSPDVRPVRIAAVAFGKPVEIEVRDLPGESAHAAIQAALAEVAEAERLANPDALNAAAGKGPQPVDARLLSLLVRAQEFCVWSDGAHGPLGRNLYELWGLRAPRGPAAKPDPELIEQALASARCDGLRLSSAKGTAELAAGSRVSLDGFVEGHAVDRAVEVLRQRGVRNGFVQIGRVLRAFGGGADRRGWKVVLPTFPGVAQPAGRFFLKNQSAALLSIEDDPVKIGNQTVLPYLHLRTGLPAQGVVGMAVVAELAVDAQALTIALALAGPREGELRLGSLRPNPSVLWFLGSGSGAPLQVDHRWGEVIAGSH